MNHPPVTGVFPLAAECWFRAVPMSEGDDAVHFRTVLPNGDAVTGFRFSERELDELDQLADLTPRCCARRFAITTTASPLTSSTPTGTQIINVITWTADAVHHHVVALRDLWVHSSVAAIDEPQVRQLSDGRSIVQVPGPDGARRYLALNADGTTSPLDLSLLPQAQAVG